MEVVGVMCEDSLVLELTAHTQHATQKVVQAFFRMNDNEMIQFQTQGE